MRASMVSGAAVAILVGATLAPVSPAVAQDGAAATTDRAGSAAREAQPGEIVLRRDGDRAVRFDPVIGAGKQPTLRRDGSQAVAFAPGPGPSTGGTQPDHFDWADAAIGAAGAVGLMLLASTAWVGVHRRRQSRLRPSVAA